MRRVGPQGVAEPVADQHRARLGRVGAQPRGDERGGLGGGAGRAEVEAAAGERPLVEVHVRVPQAGQQHPPVEVDDLAPPVRAGRPGPIAATAPPSTSDVGDGAVERGAAEQDRGTASLRSVGSARTRCDTVARKPLTPIGVDLDRGRGRIVGHGRAEPHHRREPGPVGRRALPHRGPRAARAGRLRPVRRGDARERGEPGLHAGRRGRPAALRVPRRRRRVRGGRASGCASAGCRRGPTPGTARRGRTHNDGGRGLYFDSPEGHNLEIITRPYGSGG